MPVAGAIIGGVASVGSALIGSSAAKSAANTQADAARYAADMQMKQYEQTRTDLKPYTDAGVSTLSDLVGRMDNLTSAPDPSQFREDPGYQFRFDEGRRAIEGSAASRGMLMSGGTLKALTRYGQGVADQQYGDWWNRDQMAKGNAFTKLSDLTRIGQASAAGVGAAGAAAAAGAGQAVMSGANASAAGTIGSANAMSQGLQSLGTLAQTPGLFKTSGYINPSNVARIAPNVASTISSNSSIF